MPPPDHPRLAALPAHFDARLVALGAHLCAVASLLLRLPLDTAASAQILLVRTYSQRSPLDVALLDAAMACVFLAGKRCETPVPVNDLLNVFDRLRQLYTLGPHAHTLPVLDGFSQDYYRLRSSVASTEAIVLFSLGFDLEVQLPHPLLINYLQLLDLTRPDDAERIACEQARGISLAQHAWNTLNDVLRTPAVILHPPHVLACAALQLALQHLELAPLPAFWWRVFDASWDEMEAAAQWMHWSTSPDVAHLLAFGANKAWPLTTQGLHDALAPAHHDI